MNLDKIFDEIAFHVAATFIGIQVLDCGDYIYNLYNQAKINFSC